MIFAAIQFKGISTYNLSLDTPNLINMAVPNIHCRKDGVVSVTAILVVLSRVSGILVGCL